MIKILLMCILLNIDLFIVSLSLGIQKIKIPLKNSLIVSTTNTFILLMCMLFSHILMCIFNKNFYSKLSSTLFIIIGIIEFFTLNNSSKIDTNKSKIIEYKEAILLGITVSVDSFILSVSLYELNKILFLITYFIFNFLALISNLLIEKINIKPNKLLCLISPLLFIIIGILKLIL